MDLGAVRWRGLRRCVGACPRGERFLVWILLIAVFFYFTVMNPIICITSHGFLLGLTGTSPNLCRTKYINVNLLVLGERCFLLPRLGCRIDSEGGWIEFLIGPRSLAG